MPSLFCRFGWPLGLLAACLLAGCATSPQKDCGAAADYPTPTALCSGDLSFQKPAGKSDDAPLPPIATYRAGSFADLLARVVRTSPDVGIAAAGELEARAAIGSAQASQRPGINFNGSLGPQQTWTGNPAGLALRREFGITVSQRLLDFGATQSDVLRSQATYDSATERRVAATEDVALNLVKAVLKYRIASKTVEVLTRNMGEYQKLADVVTLNLRLGNASTADAQRANARLERARTRLIDATTEREQAELEMQRIAGEKVAVGSFADLDRALSTPPPAHELTGDDNPDMLALHKEEESLQHQLAALKATSLPTLNGQLGVNYGRNMSSTDDTMLNANALLVLTFPVYDGGANQSQVDQVSARLMGVQQRIELLKRQMGEQIESTRRTAATTNGKRTSLAASVASARQVAQLNLAKYKGGESTLFELLDTYDDLAAAELELGQFDLDQEQLSAESLHLEGKLVRAILNTGN